MLEGELYEEKSIHIKELGYENIKDKVEFYQGDACNLKSHFKNYDMIIGTNLIDRLYHLSSLLLYSLVVL